MVNMMDVVTAVLGAPQNDMQATVYYIVAAMAGLLIIYIPLLILRGIASASKS